MPETKTQKLARLFNQCEILKAEIDALNAKREGARLEVAIEICPFAIDQILPLNGNRRCWVMEIMPGRFGCVEAFQLRVANVKKDNSDGDIRILESEYYLPRSSDERAMWENAERDASDILKTVKAAEDA